MNLALLYAAAAPGASPWEGLYLGILSGRGDLFPTEDLLPPRESPADEVFAGLTHVLREDTAAAEEAFQRVQSLWAQGLRDEPGEGIALGAALLLASWMEEDAAPFYDALGLLFLKAQTPGGFSLDERIWLALGLSSPADPQEAAVVEGEKLPPSARG